MPRYRESGGKAPVILYPDTVQRRYFPVLYPQWKTFHVDIVGKARKLGGKRVLAVHTVISHIIH